MVDVALTILSAKDESTKSDYARRYALDLLDRYGGVTIGYKAEWIQDKNGVPVGDWVSAQASKSLTIDQLDRVDERINNIIQQMMKIQEKTDQIVPQPMPRP
jgi:hypothetical protein